MNVLYRGYANEIVGTASGFEETVLTGSNGLQLTRSGEGYIGRIGGSSRTTTITIAGRNKGNGKTQVLGSYTYRVSNLPPPTAYFGTLGTGTATPGQLAAMKAIHVKYPPEILLDAAFSAAKWEVSIDKGPPPVNGTGALTPAALSLIKQAKKGNRITITVQYTGPVKGYASVVLTVI